MATDSIVVVAQRILSIIDTARVPLGLGALLYGDHRKISANRTVCVVPDSKRRELRNMPRGTDNTFNVQILVYHGTIEDVQQNLEDCDILAEDIEAVIHAYPTLRDPNNPSDTEGLGYNCMVTTMESGYRARGDNTQWKTHRLTVQAQSLTRLPSL